MPLLAIQHREACEWHADASTIEGMRGREPDPDHHLIRDLQVCYRPVLVAEANREFGELLFRMGEAGVPPDGLVWSEQPLTVRTESAGPDRVRASVWSVLVVAGQDRSVPRQVWHTVTIDLVWEESDWRVDGWSDALGSAGI